jgi:L,D-transpeptidase-like protein
MTARRSLTALRPLVAGVAALGVAALPAGALAAAPTRTSSAPASVVAPLATEPGGGAVLSNEKTFTRWARVTHNVEIRAAPDSGSPSLARLHFLTEDGFPEVYLLLAARRDAQGREWVKLRIPMRPNGRVGWVPRGALGPFHLTHELLVVDRRRLRLSLYDSGRLRWSAPVGIGKASSPTPAGHFWIRELFKLTDPSSGYYPYAFGTADYSTLTDWPGGGVVGIHGPFHQPQLIPGRPSHGCIRLRTTDDGWLGTHVAVGTPLLVT